MLHQHARVALLLAAIGAAVGLVLADPQPAAAEVSVGFGVVIGGGQGPRIPPGPPQRGSWYRPGRNDLFEYASRNGYVDGYEKGLEDGRARRIFDLLRHRRYRSADHDYDRRFGPRLAYQNAYRGGFRAGYEAGYREAVQRYRGNYGRHGRDGSWRRPY